MRCPSGSLSGATLAASYIPKPDGRQRPLAVAALEDKVVQRATTALLNAIHEEEFLGFSYGFRPGRGQHDALDALHVAVARQSYMGPPTLPRYRTAMQCTVRQEIEAGSDFVRREQRIGHPDPRVGASPRPLRHGEALDHGSEHSAVALAHA